MEFFSKKHNIFFKKSVLAFFIFAVPFQLRFFISDLSDVLRGNEYFSVWIWATDIIIFFIILIAILSSLKLKISVTEKLLGVFVLVTVISSVYAVNDEVSLWYLLKLLEFILLFFAMRIFSWNDVKEGLSYGLAFGALFQSFIALVQFRLQHDIGLRLFGESPLSVSIPGVAESIIGNAPILRVYGTTPHPNILALYLVVSIIIISAYLCTVGVNNKNSKSVDSIKKIFFCAAIFLSMFALVLTGSRAAWLAGGLGLIIFFFTAFVQKKVKQKDILAVGVIVGISALFAFILLQSVVAVRLNLNRYDQAVSLRIFYNQIAEKIINENPLTGIGPGTFPEHIGEPRSDFKMQDWLYQPVHNIYFLIGAESGLIALVVFLMFVGTILFKSGKRTYFNDRDEEIYKLAVLISCFTILFVGLFDHFPWTLQQGRMLLWGLLGILMI